MQAIRKINKYGVIIACCLLMACSSTKYVPEGEFLLNKMRVDIDTREVKTADLKDFIRQKPNFSKSLVRLYSLGDTTNWLKKIIRKAGDAPVIFENKQMEQSAKDIQIEMINKGFLNAEVNTITDTISRKKINLTYRICSNEPYRIRNYTINVHNQRAQKQIDRRHTRRRQAPISPGTIFDISKLEEERSAVSNFLRNIGYYTFTSDNLYYQADTTLRTNQVDLTLTVRDTIGLKPYYIHNVNLLSGYAPLANRRFHASDTIHYQGLEILYDKTHFLRPSILYNNSTIRAGQMYSERQTQQTYNLISSLSAVNKASIEYREIEVGDSTALECNIRFSPGNIHGIQLGLEGTHNAGDLGVAANTSYTHNNLFNGSEIFNIKLRGAYEFVHQPTNTESNILTQNYYEMGIATSLLFPKIVFPFVGNKIQRRIKANTQFGAGFDIQSRRQYTRNFFNFSWRYKWDSPRRNISHSLNLLTVNFVSMPYKSQEFQDYINQESNYLAKISYNDVFTAGIGYSGIYSNANRARYRANQYTLRYGIESSGNLLNSMFSLTNAGKNADGQYQLLGNPFAQYIKLDFDFSQKYQLDEKSGIALHSNIGVARPYGNSSILPFEKRYYGGGPNNVRGWSTRELGPGSYNGIKDISIQTGDISLLFNAEFRHKITPLLEVATFIDAGNIWTIQDYQNQPGGQFQWNSFYQELAVGAGIGLRVDLSFLILRLDGGKKLYDPSKINEKPWVLANKFKGNTAIYFAIGYPF